MPINSKKYLNLYFQVHQPRRLRKYHFFDIGSNSSYFDDILNKHVMVRVAQDCYGPANRMLLRLLKQFPSLRITFSLSGVVLGQLQEYAPSVLHTFRDLAATGKVEFLGETYYHSLSFLTDREEFTHQVEQHRQKIHHLLGVYPRIFRNTELIYNDEIGKVVADLGFKGVYVDGIEKLLKGRRENSLYSHPDENLVLFPRNYKLSDDIAFRYSDRGWSEYPLTADKFFRWLERIPENEGFISLGMDYETFGEHQKANSGIFSFFEQTITKIATDEKFVFVTPSEATEFLPAGQIASTSRVISWADEARDLSAWLGNHMQRDAFDSLKKLHDSIIESDNEKLMEDYRYLQTSDHFYYMSTKKNADGNVHQYFSPYQSPYEAFMNFMNVLADLEIRVRADRRRKQKFRQRPAVQSV